MKKLRRQAMAFFLPSAAVIVALGMLLAGYRCFYQAAFPVKYRALVEENSIVSGVDKALLYAVIRTESSFRPDVESSVGARGLMQITPDTLNWVRYRMGEHGTSPPEILFNPEENIRYGAQTLALLQREFGSIENALAAYHAGWGSVSRWLLDERYSSDGKTLSHIPFPDTSVYVSKALETAEVYRRLYHLSE